MTMARGKETCRILKEIRWQIAEANDIEFITSECRYKGDCLGTCPKCEDKVCFLLYGNHKKLKHKISKILKLKLAMKYLFIIMSVIFYSCSYRSDNISDRGEWVSVPVDSFVDGYKNIDGQIYWGYLVGRDFTEKENVGADIETFRVCKGTEYAKDKRHVYYPQDELCFDGIGVGGSLAGKIILEGAKPSQFKYLGKGYAVAGNKMYHNGEEIEWNDSIIKAKLY